MIKNFIQSLDNEVKEYILQDLARWKDIVQKSVEEEDPFMFFWKNRQEFRTLIRYRVNMATKHFKTCSDLIHEFNKSAGSGNYLYVTNLYISCQDIGAGFYIEHGFSTIIFAKKIGKNFRVNQNVTIGTGKGGNPSIGDNVIVGANSVIIGNIVVNDNVKIGAGTVLNFEVPEGSTVVMQKPRVIPKI